MPNPSAPAAPATPPNPEKPATPAVPAAGAPPAGTPPNPAAPKPPEVPADDFKPLEVVVDGKKLVIQTREQLGRAVQKALYADQEIKNAAQAKKGAEALMAKLKSKEGLREVLSDPEIGIDIKQLSIEWVKEFMEDEKLSPEQREARKNKTELDQIRKEREEASKKTEEDKKSKEINDQAIQFRTEIITAMKSADVPQDQMTMDATIQVMRSAYKRFGKVLPAEKAIKIVEKQYWDRLGVYLDKMEPDKILSRLGEKVLDKIQKLELLKLREKLRGAQPPAAPPATLPAGKKKDHLTEREWSERADARARAAIGGL